MSQEPSATRVPGSLKATITRWFAAIFLVLYLVSCLVVLGLDIRKGREDLRILLYAEVESAATYYAITGNLDYPELSDEDEDPPLPIWLRVIKDGAVLAATPGMPTLPVSEEEEESGQLRFLEGSSGLRLAAISHEVWNRPGVSVEAITSTRALTRRRQDLILALLLTALILVPVAALGGWVLAHRAAQPIRNLVTSVKTIDTSRLAEPLTVPQRPSEVRELATSFNELLARLEESVNQMRRFTADASHELRTPVSIMRTGLEVTLQRPRSNEDYRKVLEDNLREITRVQRIVEGLLLLARDPDAKSPLEDAQLVDLSNVAQEAVVGLKPHAEEKRVEVEALITPRLHVRGNSDRLHLLIVNLLDNAVRHTPANSKVRLELGARGTEARLLVADQGPGIPSSQQPYVFQRFFRAQRDGRKRSGSGGLGLSVVQWVAELYGGEVRLLDSEPSDAFSGARFEVLFPLVEKAEVA